MIRIAPAVRRRALTALLTALPALLVLPLAGTATATSVAVGKLAWTQTDVYDSASPANTNRTWLGYATGPGPQLANGVASAVAPATGPTLTATSDRGPDKAYTWSYPAVGGTFSTATGKGSISFAGAVSFVAPAPPAGHGFTITVERPTLVLQGDGTGVIYAAGQGFNAASAPVAYDGFGGALFSVTGATVSVADDVVTVSGLVPTLRTGVFTAAYAVGSGPNRTPNTFGGFSVSLRLGPDGDAGPAGPAGAAGRDGTNGTNGVNGTNGTNGTSTRRVVAYLRQAPFPGTKVRKVVVLRTGTVIASGTSRGRTLNLVVAPGKRIVAGRYDVRLVGSSTTRSVRIG